jgi:hyperosmotically inducible protein
MASLDLMEFHMNMSIRKIVAATVAGLVVLSLGACAAGGSSNTGQSSAGQYVDDAALTTKVKAALLKDVGAKGAAEVKVTTEGGVVQLSGFVDSPDEATRAAAAAQKVNGVRSIKNDIRIKGS